MAVNALEMRRRLITSQPHLETVSGAVASFIWERFPLKSCKASIDPVQDLHGYEHPWPAGGGKNLFGGEFNQNFALYIPSGTVVTAYADTVVTVSYYASNGTTRIDYWSVSPSGKTFTLIDDAYYFKFDGGSEQPSKMYVAIEGSFSGYTPYSNICPITGWTGAKVTRTGKNLFDQNRLAQLTGWVVEDGVFKGNSSAWEALGNMLSKSPETKQVTVSFDGYVNYENSRAGYIRFNYTDGTASYVEIIGQAWAHYVLTSTSGKTISSVELRFSNQRETWLKNVQVEYGSTATAYEPYSGQTVDVQFPAEAGTVYGGSLDVTNGVLTVDRAMVVLTSDINLEVQDNSARFYWIKNKGLPQDFPYSASVGAAALVCNTFPSEKYNTQGCVWSIYGQIHLWPPASIIPSGCTQEGLAELKTWLSNNPVTFIYKLATTITYQLTPQEITTLIGTNNVWADTGDISVTYWKH